MEIDGNSCCNRSRQSTIMADIEEDYQCFIEKHSALAGGFENLRSKELEKRIIMKMDITNVEKSLL